MTYTVTKSSPTLVPPASSTPSCTLPLSSVDLSSSFNVELISVFSYGEKPTARIKDALAKALVHYYPVAGRIAWLKDTPQEPVVDCTGDGVWFVEAVANCTLADVKYLEVVPHMIPNKELLPSPPPGVKLENQILMVQITEFTCGGFTIGLWLNHMVFDGQGANQFLKAIGEMARGLPEPSMKPVWSRDDIPYPPVIQSGGQNQSFTAFNFSRSIVDISLDSLNRAKKYFFTKTGLTCTSFEIVNAMVFKSRVKTINLGPKQKVSLMYAASTRCLLHAVFPSMEGYYGNCVYGVEINKTSEEINNASLIEVVKLVKDSKEAFPIEFMNWMNGKSQSYSQMKQDYRRLIVSDWRHIWFNEVDFGWGDQLKYIFPRDVEVIAFASGVSIKPPKPKQGIRLILHCVEENQLDEFYREMENIQTW